MPDAKSQPPPPFAPLATTKHRRVMDLPTFCARVLAGSATFDSLSVSARREAMRWKIWCVAARARSSAASAAIRSCTLWLGFGVWALQRMQYW